MIPVIHAIFFVLSGLIQFFILLIVVVAVLSWLMAFDIINPRNPIVSQLNYILDRVTRPVLAPFQRIIPSLGGVDISPVVAILILAAIRLFILPAIEGAIVGMIASPTA